MAETMQQPTVVRTFLTDMPAVTAKASLTLLSKRSAAVTDFWRSVAEIRQPTELMAVQLGYWTQLVDDYQEAFTEGCSEITAPAPAHLLTVVESPRVAQAV